MLNEMMQAQFIYSHIVRRNNLLSQLIINLLQWKDSSQDFVPDGNGIT